MNEDELEWESGGERDSRFLRKPLSRSAGGQALGCSLYEILPGGRDWPYHFHHGNEKAVYALAGKGVLQSPAGEREVRAGDYLVFTPGVSGAHRFHNPSDGPLRFLCLSTMTVPDVVEYPERGRLGVFCLRERTRRGSGCPDPVRVLRLHCHA